MQNEDVEDSNAQSLPPDNIHHSGKYQNSSSWHGMPPNAGDDAIGNGPGPRVSGLHDFFPSMYTIRSEKERTKGSQIA
jgi:hypothetical protein